MFHALQKSARALGAAVLLGCVVLVSNGAIAKQTPLIPDAALRIAGGGISLQQAAIQAREQHGGKVVKAETVLRDGREVHRIRLVKGGRVSTVIIDATSGGEILR